MRAAFVVTLASLLLASSCSLEGLAGGPLDAGAPGDAGAARDVGLDGGALPKSCRALHEAEPALANGIYVVDPDGAGAIAPQRVYCEMAIAGGGWTLVGRSMASAAGVEAFGWYGVTGSVDDDTKPYSLGAAVAVPGFTEMLVAAHGGSKAIFQYAYRIGVPADFVTVYAEKAYAVASTPAALGDCTASRVLMLAYSGHTRLNGVFWFRDEDNPTALFGLAREGWDLYFPDGCEENGHLLGKQGMIFVR